jgi:two-component sensor histidine kinase
MLVATLRPISAGRRDGVGYDGSGPKRGTGLGSRIVKAMAHGLSGTVTFAIGQHGTIATVTFRPLR